MIGKRGRLGFVLVALAVLVGPTAAADWSQSDLGKTKMGEVWLGEAPKAEDLKGKVVLMEFWGVNCGPCIASLPHMVEWNNQCKKKGLVVIGAHAQGPLKDRALEICKKQKVNYTILANAQVPGLKFSGIPHAALFDPDGKMIWHGHPMDKQMAGLIVTNLKNVKSTEEMLRAERAAKILGQTEYAKLDSAAEKVKNGHFASAYKQCLAAKDKEGDVGEEAKALLAGLDADAKALLDKADQGKLDSPLTTENLLQQIAGEYAGTLHGDAAKKTLAELKTNADFQNEIKAEREYLTIAETVENIPERPDDPAKAKAWKARHTGNIRALQARIERFKKKYPDSPFGAKAERLLAPLVGEE
jgi:thiol-disulfide isomerase/thioredoxin